VLYVWFDALVDYVSALGWPNDNKKFKEFWPVVQVAGKDNLRQQAAMWQAMLLSAGLPSSKQILIFGFLTVDGQKMSKSVGNVINPFELVEKYGTDAVRYYLLAEILPFEDGDFSYEKFEFRYNADLANGLGNLASRVSNLLEKNEIKLKLKIGSDKKLEKGFEEKMNKYRFDEALKLLWEKLRADDEFLSAKAPWKMEDKKEIEKVLEVVVQDILNVAFYLQPFLPGTAEKIIEQYSEEQIRKGEPLFIRINNK
jgi:methionyl-tRNA synthetase